MKTYVFVAVLALLLLGACNPSKKPREAAPAPGVKPPVTAAPSGTAGPVKFGFNLEETGNAATFGVSAHKGAELALSETNAAGGVLGQQVEAVWDDNASVADQSAKVASKLINQDKVTVIIGCLTSSNTIAMAKIADEAGLPVISPAATNPKVTLNDDGSVRKYVFRACFTDDFQGERIVDFAINGPIKAKNAVIFYDADSDYSRGIWETVKRVAPQLGLEIVAEDSFLASSETDFRTKLNKFKTVPFDVLIVPGYYIQVANIANQARELGITQPMVGGDGWDSPDLWKVAGKNIEGSYFTNHYAADDQDPAVQDFIRKYKERYGGNVPDSMAILSYDATKLAADAITRAGSTDPDAIASAIAATKGFKGAAGAITMSEKHNATKKLVVIKVGEGGKPSWVYTYDPSKAAGAGAAAPAGQKGGAAEGGESTPPADGDKPATP
jgi:branched-chain amino acid transport system substrate-binding protein